MISNIEEIRPGKKLKTIEDATIFGHSLVYCTVQTISTWAVGLGVSSYAGRGPFFTALDPNCVYKIRI